MGKYINKNSKGEQLGSSFRNKITGLINDGGRTISEPQVFEKDDGRDRVWLVYPHANSVAQ